MYNNMYEVFDPFLASQTWHGTKQADRERFYLALDRVAREAAFDPEEMGDYLRAKLGLPSGDDHDDTAVARRVTDAWAVRDFWSSPARPISDARSPWRRPASSSLTRTAAGLGCGCGRVESDLGRVFGARRRRGWGRPTYCVTVCVSSVRVFAARSRISRTTSLGNSSVLAHSPYNPWVC